MHLSVVIPCFNEADVLACQLDALAQQSTPYDWEVILADNGSWDDSITVAAQYQAKLPNLRIVQASEQRGASYARNVGANAATGEALAFCDADDEVAPGWITAIVEALSQYDFVASQFDFEKLNQTQLSRSHAYAPRYQQKDELQTKPYATLPYAGTSGLAIKHAIHQWVGGFDESLLCCEDTDYCWRVQLMGFSLHLMSTAVIHIRRRSSSLGIYQQSAMWAQYNVLLYKKYQATSVVPLASAPNRNGAEWCHLGIDWLKMLVKLLLAMENRGQQTQLLYIFAYQTGRLRSCIRYRTLCPW